MNTVKPDFRGSADELDCLLRRFFQAEMPEPWPELKAPAGEASSGRSLPWRRYRSKLALAASVALLLLGSWWLAGRSADYTTPVIQYPPGSGIGDIVDPMRTPATLDKP